MRFKFVPPSPKPLLTAVKRWISRFVWGKWMLSFLGWEATGDWVYTPWATFSETVWDIERECPGTKRKVVAFALALADHMEFRTELRGSWEWALANVDEFEAWLQEKGGSTGPQERFTLA